MNRLHLLVLLLLFTAASLEADYLNSIPVGPGVIHHHEFRAAGPWHLHVLEIDLTDSLNKLETIKADNNVYGYETTSSMSDRSNGPGHRAVGGINGDFYASGGITIGAQIIKGSLVKRPYPRSVFAMSDQKRPLINVVGFDSEITVNGNEVIDINGINETRQENFLVLYNRFHGSSTRANQWGTEIQVDYIDEMQVNATVRAVVSQMDSSMTVGNMAIPGRGSAILSGHGTARDFLNAHMNIGDTILVKVGLPPTDSNLLELIGGTPRLIRNGVKSVEWEQESIGSSFTFDRHPRTAVGFSDDSTKVYFFTVDGRQAGYSVGMSLFELADYMLEWGVHQGVNLDGGGSTTMVVRGNVKNSPSDGTERSVGNSLLVISTATEGPLAHLFASPKEAFVPVESSLKFAVRGTDAYYNPLSLNGVTIEWNCDPMIGSIDGAGTFTAAADTGTGYVTVQAGAIIDTMLVHLTDVASLKLQPDPVVLKVGESQAMSVEARDNYGNVIQADLSAYSWSVTTSIASISTSGVVSGENIGVGTIQATLNNVSTSVPLTVGANSTVVIDDFSTAGNYSVSGLRVDLGGCSLTPSTEQFVSAPSSGKLNYSLTTGGTTVLYLNCNLPISSTPESVSIQVYGDNSGHWLRGEFKVPNGDYMLVNFTEADPGINWTGWQNIIVDLESASAKFGYPNAVLDFPITWTKIYLAETDETKKDIGVIYLDDFSAQFVSTGIDRGGSESPKAFALIENYPNPFNATTHFVFDVPSSGTLIMEIFDINGRQVDNLPLEVSAGSNRISWHPSQIPSGLYFYRAVMGDRSLSGKCLLLK